MRITVRVKPGSRKTFIREIGDGELEICVREPASEGKANRAVIEAVALRAGVAKSRVRMARGHRGKNKILEVL